jgi:glucuronoarabinoxylan endo-1,4-beta-xylanase
LKTVITTLGTEDWRVQTTGTTFTNLGVGQATRIRFRARAATAGTRVRFVMQSTIFSSQNFSLSTAWTEYTWNHTAVEISPQLRIQFPDLGTVWLDEIRVEKVITPILPNPSVRRQVMDGLGGALTWHSANIFNANQSAANRAALEKLIFDDLGLDIIRLKNWYFPLDWPTNKSPSNISNVDPYGNFRTNHNNNKTFYDMAKKNGRDIQVLLSSWSPPAILKSNNDMRNGGTLKKVNNQFVYADLAQYWVDMLDNQTWTPDYLSFQNEPGYTSIHETCIFASVQTSTTAGYGQALDAIHNRIKTRANVPIFVGGESENMNSFLGNTTISGSTITFDSSADVTPLASRPHVGINAYHTYDLGGVQSNIDSPTTLSKFNKIRSLSRLGTANNIARKNWMSEYSAGDYDWLDTAHLIHTTFVEADASAYIFWKLVWANSTATEEHMITVNTSSYTVFPTYWGIMHFSKEISRGDQRFDVTQPDFTNTNVRVSGYVNPAGKKITLVAINIGTAPADISLSLSGLPVASATAFQSKDADIGTNGAFPANSAYQALSSFNYTQVQNLPARSITTYVVNLSQTLNPYDPALLRVDDIQHHGNQVSLTMPSQLGYIPVLWRSSNLAAGSWAKVTNALVTESNGQAIITDPTPIPGKAFYRVEHD